MELFLFVNNTVAWLSSSFC